jgi:hypothetical protein
MRLPATRMLSRFLLTTLTCASMLFGDSQCRCPSKARGGPGGGVHCAGKQMSKCDASSENATVNVARYKAIVEKSTSLKSIPLA